MREMEKTMASIVRSNENRKEKKEKRRNNGKNGMKQRNGITTTFFLSSVYLSTNVLNTCILTLLYI
jgi:hypothetical protein